jgi:hypothetical protein
MKIMTFGEQSCQRQFATLEGYSVFEGNPYAAQ